MVDQKINALEESLNKKVAVLEQLQKLSDKQSQLLADSSMSLEEFDACMDEQDILVGSLMELDEGFDTLYKNLKESMPDDRTPYQQQITRIQDLAREITTRSELLSKTEASNKEKLTQYFQKERKSFGEGRRSSKAALDYYKNMSGSNMVPSYFMDQKQ